MGAEEELADIGISKTGHRKRIMRWVKQNPASPVYSPRSKRGSISFGDAGSSELFLADPAGAARMMAEAAATGSASSTPTIGGHMGNRLPSFGFSPYSPFTFIKARSGGADLNSPHSTGIDLPQEERARKVRALYRKSLAAPLVNTGRCSAAAPPPTRGIESRPGDVDTASKSGKVQDSLGGAATKGLEAGAGPSKNPRWVSGEETNTRPLSPLPHTKLNLEQARREEVHALLRRTLLAPFAHLLAWCVYSGGGGEGAPAVHDLSRCLSPQGHYSGDALDDGRRASTRTAPGQAQRFAYVRRCAALSAQAPNHLHPDSHPRLFIELEPLPLPRLLHIALYVFLFSLIFTLIIPILFSHHQKLLHSLAAVFAGLHAQAAAPTAHCTVPELKQQSIFVHKHEDGHPHQTMACGAGILSMFCVRLLGSKRRGWAQTMTAVVGLCVPS
jgi:hypothetical protein